MTTASEIQNEVLIGLGTGMIPVIPRIPVEALNPHGVVEIIDAPCGLELHLENGQTFRITIEDVTGQ